MCVHVCTCISPSYLAYNHILKAFALCWLHLPWWSRGRGKASGCLRRLMLILLSGGASCRLLRAGCGEERRVLAFGMLPSNHCSKDGHWLLFVDSFKEENPNALSLFILTRWLSSLPISSHCPLWHSLTSSTTVSPLTINLVFSFSWGTVKETGSNAAEEETWVLTGTMTWWNSFLLQHLSDHPVRSREFPEDGRWREEKADVPGWDQTSCSSQLKELLPGTELGFKGCRWE